MDIKELRIGNILWDNAMRKQFYVLSIQQDYLTGRDNDGWFVDGDPKVFFSGIPLTSEWLEEKAGFEKITSNVPHLAELESFDGQRQFRWDSIDGLAIQTVGSGWIWRLKHIKYVHQFMNLYFDVTGKELTIK